MARCWPPPRSPPIESDTIGPENSMTLRFAAPMRSKSRHALGLGTDATCRQPVRPGCESAPARASTKAVCPRISRRRSNTICPKRWKRAARPMRPWPSAHKMAAKKSRPRCVRLREAWVLYHAKRYDEAYKAYKAIVDKYDSDYSSGRESRVAQRSSQHLVEYLRGAHRMPEAEKCLEQILDEYPDQPGGLIE